MAADPLTENDSHHSALDPLYESRLAGWLEGYHSRDGDIDRLTWEADRLYTAMCSRTPKPYVDRPSYADLERLRGNAENADQIDAQNAVRFSEVSK